MAGPVFGAIEGVPEGSCFASRRELAKAGVHRQLQAGISGTAKEGADSIVLSGGYEDDCDYGDVIIYTGQGGRDESSKSQTEGQELTRGNWALAVSKNRGLPVRVVRGSRHKSQWSPREGYEYAGLYIVEEYWSERGRSGFLVWKYRLVKIDDR